MAKGLYTPVNPQKYLGDPTKIRFLSSWELRFFEFCDKSDTIIKWGSEEFKIPYFNPIYKQIRQYIPDVLIKYKDRTGNLITEVVEIKPSKEAQVKAKMSNYDKVMLVINTAKWRAAGSFCASHGIRFRVLTEAGSILIGPNGEQTHSKNGLFK